MTAHIHRAPTPLQPRLKAPPTASSAHLDALVTKSTASSQPPSPTKSHTPVSRSATLPVDTSDRATAALIRRVLCPANSYQDNRNTPRPIEDLLPPLTSSNEIDLQLYAIIAIVLKEYVYSWYGRITPDRVFVDEIVQLIAHCTRALEERLRKVDLELLLFDEIPALVEAHVVAYRAAHRPFHPPQLASDPRHIYHTLNPHPALSPVPDPSIPESIEEEQVNETAYRQLLVQGTLAVLLPTEDLENAPLRTLVGDVLADLIIGSGIAGKLCEGWFIWSSIIKAVEIHSQKAAPEHSVESKESQLEKCGLLPSVSTEKNKGSSAGSKVPSWRISIVLWQVLQYCYLTLVVFRFVVVGLFQAGTIPSRQTWVGTVSASTTPPTKTPIEGSFNPSRIGSGRRRPILAYRLFSLVSTLLDLSTRMPWLAGILSLVQHQVIDGPGQVGDTDGIVDRFLSQTLHTYLSNTTPTKLLAPLLLSFRLNFFPQNTLGPPAPPAPSESETLVLRRRCAEAIASVLPESVMKLYFPLSPPSKDKDGDEGDETKNELLVREIEEHFVRIFEDGYMNRRVVYGILEALVLGTVPELGGRGVEELMGGRLEQG